MDRGVWWVTVNRVTKNWHNLVTKTTIKPLLAVHTSDEKFEISFNDMGGSVCKREDLRSERSM